MLTTSPEEMARQLAKSSGAQASIPEKTAEAVGERVGDAYADPGSVAVRLRQRSSGNGATEAGLNGVRQMAQLVSDRFDEQPFMIVIASFALGYMTALLLHGRR